MNHDIRPTTPADLSELGAFLAEGFRAPADAPFAGEDVLLWKYFDPRGSDAGDAPRSLLARDPETGRVVGHLGVTPGRFRGPGFAAGVDGVPTLHMIDWLSSKAGQGVGASLMRRAHRATPTGYGLGGSADGRGVGGAGGYDLVALVPVYLNVLRPAHRLKTPGLGLTGRLLRLANDLARRASRPARRPELGVELRPAGEFGAEVGPVLDAYRAEAAFTTREPALLNHLLRYPKGGLTGWHVVARGATRGFALLSVLARPGGVREGRVVDCVLDDPADPALWHAAMHALTRELKVQGADTALAFASTGWTARALEAAGYVPASPLEFRLRDRKKEIPRDAPFHLTPLEADYAYT